MNPSPTRTTIISVLLTLLLCPAGGADPPKDSLDRNYQDELPRVQPVEPEKAIGTFKVAPGFRLELVAHEPLVVDPIAMAFDEDGRLFVVEMRGYSEQGDENLGRVRLLSDDNGDGKFDSATVYVDGLSWPTALACFRGGIFVAAAPDIWYCKDTDGDGRADVKEKFFTGFGRGNVQGLVNTFLWGLDSRIHGATSSSGATVRRVAKPSTNTASGGRKPPEHKSKQDTAHTQGADAPRSPDDAKTKEVSLRGRDFSFDPRTLDLRAESGGGQHGMSFNDWGEKFVCSNSNHLQMVMFDDRYFARNPYYKAPSPRISIATDGPQADVFRASPVEPWRVVRTRLRKKGLVPGPVERGGRAAGYFTGATGVTICRGDAFLASGERQFPETTTAGKKTKTKKSQGADAPRSPELYGYAIIGDVGSNLVHRKRLEQGGLTYVGRRVDEESELVASSDIWFRPVQFASGPDGALYIADMYREVIEHPKSLHPVIKKHLDLTSGRDRGRIYRLVPEGFEQPDVPRLSTYTPRRLAAILDHPNAWHRESAARLLFQQEKNRKAIGELLDVAALARAPQARIGALHVLHGQGALVREPLVKALEDEHPRVREHAVRLAEARLVDPVIVDKLLGMVDDESLHVRYQLAFTLGELNGPRRDAMLELIRRDGNNKWIAHALMSSASEGAGNMLRQLAVDNELRETPAGRQFIARLAAQIGKQQRTSDVAALLQLVAELSSREDGRATAQLIVRSTGAKGKLAEQIAAATGGKSDQWRSQLLRQSRRAALNESLPAAQRAAAIHRLSLGSLDEDREIFATLLLPQQPGELQRAALASLGRYDDGEVAALLLARWPQLGPALRGPAIEVLLSRDLWVGKLLDAIAAGEVAATEIQAGRLKVLATRDDPQIRAQAEKLLAEKLARRGKLLARYQTALETEGDVERGRAVFRKHCAACHKLEDVGHEIGPQLASAATRGPEAILVNVLDPNREVNPQYVNYVVITKGGRSLSGMIAAETATSVTLVRGEKASDTVLRIDIDQMQSTGTSLMPEGLEKEIDPQAMADLLSYLLSHGQ